ncbi:MAG: Flp pilus assembly complex ATPase component TadA [Phycisphaerales bacterium]|nr:Flp pilus assembly complex ATPase component TadA [Phycisphaerales bacterium]
MTESFSSVATTLTLADGLVLVSWFKPLLMLAVLGPWAWVVSAIYDKDAVRWYFKRQAWNLGHMAAAIAAVGVVLLAPLTFWITWPIMAVILIVDLAVYFLLRNADDRVPAGSKWRLNVGAWLEARAARKQAKVQAASVSMSIKGPKGVLQPPLKDSPEFEIRAAAEDLLRRALDARASQLDIMPAKANVYAAAVRVDGVQTVLSQLPAPQAIAVMDFLKGAAGLDVSDRRRKLRGDFKAGPSAMTMYDMSISTQGGSEGMRLTLLIEPAKQVTMKADELGLLPAQRQTLDELIRERKGVVLLAAPGDGGRTTTLYSVVKLHDAYTSNVQTLETEPQATLEGVRQNHFDANGEAEYATTVRSILRRDPQVLGVAECPDDATAKEVARSDGEQTRVYLSLRADSEFHALQIYLQRVGDKKAAAKSLHGVVSQKLARRLCANCRVPFQPTPDMLKKLGLPESVKQLYRKGGTVIMKDKEQTCPVCSGGGHFGQVGVFTVHAIGPAERDLIASEDWQGLRAAFRQHKEPSLREAGLQQVMLGQTTVEEVARITEERKPAPPKPAAGGEARPAQPAAT